MNNIKRFSSRKEVTEFLKEKGIDTSNWSEEKWLQLNKGQGEIHIMKIAEMIYDELQASTPVLKMAGDWHIPYFNNYKNSYYPIHSDRDLTPEDITVKNLVKISTSMAARESYTVVGENKEVTFDEHLKLYDRLVSYEPPHSSPMEHCAEAMPELEYGMFTKTFYKFDEDIEGFTKVTEEGWCRNFRGFIPLRHKIEENK